MKAHNNVVFACKVAALAVAAICVPGCRCGYANGYEDGFKDGQVAAANGDVRVTLYEHPNKTKSWVWTSQIKEK